MGIRVFLHGAALKHLIDRKRQSVGALQTEVQQYQDNLGLVLDSSAGGQTTHVIDCPVLALLTESMGFN